jgi:hypothetical protein
MYVVLHNLRQATYVTQLTSHEQFDCGFIIFITRNEVKAFKIQHSNLIFSLYIEKKISID